MYFVGSVEGDPTGQWVRLFKKSYHKVRIEIYSVRFIYHDIGTKINCHTKSGKDFIYP